MLRPRMELPQVAAWRGNCVPYPAQCAALFCDISTQCIITTVDVSGHQHLVFVQVLEPKEHKPDASSSPAPSRGMCIGLLQVRGHLLESGSLHVTELCDISSSCLWVSAENVDYGVTCPVYHSEWTWEQNKMMNVQQPLRQGTLPEGQPLQQ